LIVGRGTGGEEFEPPEEEEPGAEDEVEEHELGDGLGKKKPPPSESEGGWSSPPSVATWCNRMGPKMPSLQ
jgi:hypothetical protein